MRKYLIAILFSLACVAVASAAYTTHNTILNGPALGSWDDLTTPTSTQKYQLGSIWDIKESTADACVQQYEYVASTTALVANQAYVINVSTIAGKEVFAGHTTNLSSTTVPQMQVCVPQVAFTSGYYGFVLIAGKTNVLLTAETYVPGDALQLIDGNVALVVDGTTGDKKITANTCALCAATGSTAVAQAAVLLNKKATIAAS